MSQTLNPNTVSFSLMYGLQIFSQLSMLGLCCNEACLFFRVVIHLTMLLAISPLFQPPHIHGQCLVFYLLNLNPIQGYVFTLCRKAKFLTLKKVLIYCSYVNLQMKHEDDELDFIKRQLKDTAHLRVSFVNEGQCLLSMELREDE